MSYLLWKAKRNLNKRNKRPLKMKLKGVKKDLKEKGFSSTYFKESQEANINYFCNYFTSKGFDVQGVSDDWSDNFLISISIKKEDEE